MTYAKQLVEEAIDASDTGSYRRALRLLAKAIKLEPSDPQAYFERAIVFLNMDQDQEALPDFDRCLELDPAFPGARDWRARALAGTGKLRLAADEQLRSLREHPDGKYVGMGVSPQAWADCAEAFVKAGRAAQAVDLLDEYLEVHAKKVSSYACYETAPLRTLARLLLQVDPDRAVGLARTAYLNVRHRCPADFVVYALALEAAGQDAEALHVADEALAQNYSLEEAAAVKRRLTGIDREGSDQPPEG